MQLLESIQMLIVLLVLLEYDMVLSNKVRAVLFCKVKYVT